MAKALLNEEAKLVNLMMEKFANDEEQERQAELARVSRREQYKKEIEEQKRQRLHMYEVEKTNELVCYMAHTNAIG